MAKVLGVGGIFFRSKDPAALLAWYQKWLGFPAENPGHALFFPAAMPVGACTVFSPFPDDTDYFSPSERPFMFNLVVDSLAEALEQVKAGGAVIAGETKAMEPIGTFAWFVDPEGNKVELWEPSKAVSAGT
jgi:predicted enzyme related to lactoylglutathione lyase